jgi:hypothetical protein
VNLKLEIEQKVTKILFFYSETCARLIPLPRFMSESGYETMLDFLDVGSMLKPLNN